MAYFATPSDYFSTTTGLLSLLDANRTVMAWVRNRTSVTGGQYNTIYDAGGAFPIDDSEGGLFTQSGNHGEQYQERPGGFFVDVSAGTFAAGTWFHICWVRDGGTTHRFLLNGVLAIAPYTFDLGGAPTPATTAVEVIGADGFPSDETGDFDVLYFRAWNTTLTDEEVGAEMVSTTAVHTGSLWRDTPLVSDGLDISGNGRDWTTNGSITFPPDTPFPDTTDPADAIDLGTMPVTYSASLGADSLFNLWYTFTTPGTINVAGIFVFGDLVNYQPSFQLYTGTPPTLALYWDETFISGDPKNKATQCHVAPSTTYYLKVLTNFPVTYADAEISISIIVGPNLSVAAGDIFIIDDFQISPPHGEYVHPGVFLSGTTGAVLNFDNTLPAPTGFASGLSGDILPSGVMLFEDDPNNRAIFYNADFTVGATLAYTPSVRVRANRVADKFYVAKAAGGSTNIRVVSNSGAELAAYSFATGGSVVYALATKNDESLLYYGFSLTSAIKTRTIPGMVAGADLVAAVANYFLTSLLVLYDGTLIALYLKNTGLDTYAVQYDATGATLNTYALGPTIAGYGDPVLGYDNTSGVATDVNFWVLTHHTDNIHRLRQIRIADGFVLHDFETPEYEEGVYSATATETPTARFGPPGSCPFVVLQDANAFTGGNGAIEVVKVTDPTGDPAVFSFDAFGGLSPVSFTLSDGQTELYSAVTPGSGYGITESQLTGWAEPVYEVSNDSPIDNITVDVGELVIVTVTNTFVGGGGGGVPQVDPIRRERWFPVVSQEQHRLFFHKLQLYFESGTGINDGQGSNPLVELDWSDDGGHTWSHLHLLESGPMGQYKRRIIQRMMGQSRERIYRVAVSDPVQWSLIDSFFDITEGTS